MNNDSSKGEKCQNPGCEGILEEEYTGSSCSCHINPPCGYCEHAWERLYCPACDWTAEDDETFIPNVSTIKS